MTASPSFDVLGTPISAVKLPDVLSFVDETVETNRSDYVCVCAVNNVMSAYDDGELAKIHEDAGLCVPDGYPLAWIGRRRFPGTVERIRGTDLVRALADHAAEEGYSLFLYGAAEGVPEKMAEALQDRAPTLEIAGTYSPPFRPLTPAEDQEVTAMINAANPEIVLVGLPTPKQDRWMAEHRDRLDANVLFGVGAAFDFIAGEKQEAPTWVQDSGTEWLWRFAHEPTRLWRRVVLQGPKFLGLLAKQRVTQATGDLGARVGGDS